MTGRSCLITHYRWDRTDLPQVTNFLNQLADGVDFDLPVEIENPEKVPGRVLVRGDATKDDDSAPRPEFHPMQRKLAIPLF